MRKITFLIVLTLAFTCVNVEGFTTEASKNNDSSTKTNSTSNNSKNNKDNKNKKQFKQLGKLSKQEKADGENDMNFDDKRPPKPPRPPKDKNGKGDKNSMNREDMKDKQDMRDREDMEEEKNEDNRIFKKKLIKDNQDSNFKSGDFEEDGDFVILWEILTKKILILQIGRMIKNNKTLQQKAIIIRVKRRITMV